MKKIVIYIVCIIITITTVAYIYYQVKSKKSDIETNNVVYDNLLEKELTGNKLATIINKTLDNNERNKIEKDGNGLYIENDTNSIKIEIKFKLSDNIFPIESIYTKKVSEFIRLYGQANFKCLKIEYHKKTKFVKYLYFEEI